MKGLLDNPLKMQMVMNGLGLLGTKYEDSANRYRQGIMGSLSAQAEAKQREKERAETKAQQDRLYNMQLEKHHLGMQNAADKKAYQDQFTGLMGSEGEMGERWTTGGSGYLGGEYDLKGLATRAMAIPGYTQYGTSLLGNVLDAEAAGAKSTTEATAAGQDTEFKLRKEYTDQSKDFMKQAGAYKRVVSSAQDPSGAGDLALIFNYMKVLDPGSTVREGEFATAQNSGGVESKIRSLYNQAIDGQRLTHTQRRDFVDRAGRLYSGALELHDQLGSRYSALADSYGVNANNILYSPGTEIYQYPADLVDGDEPSQEVEATKTIGGKEYVKINGQWMEKE